MYKNKSLGISLVVRYLRIHLAMQGTQVQSLVKELKFPHAAEQLNLRVTTTEAPTFWSLRVATREAMHRRENFRMPQLRLDEAK